MKTEEAFRGTWTITEMEVWDRDAFELLGRAFFEFDGKGSGRFRFIAVEGWMDCRFGTRDGKPLVEFSWNGRDENHPATGRGWAVVEGEVMVGRIFLHLGDDSSFQAARGPAGAAAGTRRSRRRT
ncbi:MAG: hypothetical protein AB7U23_14860 [Dehalococcoidia bacterium]